MRTIFLNTLPYAFAAALLLGGCAKLPVDDVAATVNAKPTYGFEDKNGFDLYIGNGFTIGSTFTLVTLNRLELYISNIKLIRDDGSSWSEPNSYHLLSLPKDPTTTSTRPSFTLAGIPTGTYKAVEVSFGVDSAHNHSLDHVGDLDPANGMAWAWAAGYRFMILEGTYVKDAEDKPLIWHIGMDANYRANRRISFESPMTFTPDSSANMSFLFNTPAFFSGLHTLLPADHPALHGLEAECGLVADNVISAISVSIK